MSYEDVLQELPTLRQKLAVLGLGLCGVAFIVWLVWRRRLREEHALLWFMGLLAGIVIVWCDPLLGGLSYALGVNVPANALLLVALFFLFGICVWLTSVASRNKLRLERLTIHVSTLNAQVAELQAALGKGPADASR